MISFEFTYCLTPDFGELYEYMNQKITYETWDNVRHHNMMAYIKL